MSGPAPLLRVAGLADRLGAAMDRRLRRRLLLLLLPFVLAAAAGTVRYARQPRVYAAQGLLRLEPSARYRGHPVSRKAMRDEVQWLSGPSFLAEVRRSVEAQAHAAGTAPPSLRGASLGAHLIAGTNLLELEAVGPDPEVTYAIVRGALAAVAALHFARENAVYAQQRQLLAGRLRTLEQGIAELRRDFAGERAAGFDAASIAPRFARSRRGGLGEPPGDDTAAQDSFDYTLNLLRAAGSRADETIRQAEARLRAASAGGDAPASGLETPVAAAGRQAVLEAEAQAATAAATLGPNAPASQEAAARLLSLRQSLEDERRRELDLLGWRVELARRQQQAIAKAYQARAEVVSRTSTLGAAGGLRDLELAVDLGAYDRLRRRIETLRLDLGGGPIVYDLVDPGAVPAYPLPRSLRAAWVGPLQCAILAFLLLAGLLAAGAGASWRPRELTRVVEAPLGAVVGFVPGQTAFAASPAYRDLAETLAAQPGPRTVVVTSAQPSDGKTRTSLALAAALAEAVAARAGAATGLKEAGAEAQSERVLLVDADLHRPAVARRLRLTGGRGLGHVLAGRAAVEEAIVPCAEVAGLDVLPAGPASPQASELLLGADTAALLLELGTRYRLIVVDAPPLLAVSDALPLGRTADVLVFVARFGRRHAARQAVRRAALLCRRAGLRVDWAVLNAVPEPLLRDRPQG